MLPKWVRQPGGVTGLEQVERLSRELADPVVLEMDHRGPAGVLVDDPDRIHAAPGDPVHVDLEPDRRRGVRDDVEEESSVVLGELDVVIVVVQPDPVLGQAFGVVVGPLGEVEERVHRAEREHRQHPDPQQPGVQALGVGHDGVELDVE